MQIDPEIQDFGKVKEGEKIGVEYTLTNIGKDNLEIEVVSACDCLLVDWTLEPIPPAGKGKITVIFDTAGRPGKQDKDLDVIFKNTDARDYPLVKRALLKLEVIPKTN